MMAKKKKIGKKILENNSLMIMKSTFGIEAHQNNKTTHQTMGKKKHRGKDTRTTFTDHLYTALTQAGIHTFRDDDEIERGEDIKRGLEKAIQQSKVAVIVFSPNYASLSWCLDELVLINERRNADLGHVLPIFYRVDPCLVRRQRGSFGESFARHEKGYKVQPDKLEEWKSALKEVADLSSEVLKDQ